MGESGFAYFVERPRRMEDLLVPHPLERERAYEIVRTVTLAGIDYESFITDLLADRGYIEESAPLCSEGEVWKCLLVRQRGHKDGVLVLPRDGRYVGWAAYRAGIEEL